MDTIDIYDLWITFLAAVNAEQGGWAKPQTNFQAWVNEISLELFREKIKSFETSQQISDDLAPFLLSINVVLQTQTGKNYDLALYPPSYSYYGSARVLYNEKANCGCVAEDEGMQLLNKDGACKTYDDPDYVQLREKNRGADICEVSISKIINQQWGNACDHAFKKPTPAKPILTQFEQGFKVAPKGLGIIVLDYLKLPRKAVFAYTLGPNDEVIYNASASIQLEWGGSLKGEFIARLIKRYGMFTREEQLYAMGEQEREINK